MLGYKQAALHTKCHVNVRANDLKMFIDDDYALLRTCRSQVSPKYQR